MIKEQCNNDMFIMLSKPQSRPKTRIVTSPHADQAYISTMKGFRSDTKELNINIKTLTLSYLRQLTTANELTSEETQIIANYAKMPACFQSITYLFFGGGGKALQKKKLEIAEKPQQELSSEKIQQKEILEINARENIRRNCKNFYRSTFFIKGFFRSSRMHFKNKLIILKYLKKIQYLPFRRFKQKSFQWKNIDFQG